MVIDLKLHATSVPRQPLKQSSRPEVPADTAIVSALQLAIASVKHMALNITNEKPLKLLADLVLQWSSSRNPNVTPAVQDTIKALFKARSAGDPLATSHKKQKDPLGEGIPIVPPSEPVSYHTTKRLHNRGQAPKQKGARKRVRQSVLELFTLNTLQNCGLLAKDFAVAYFGGGAADSEEAAEWLEKNAMDTTGPVGLHIYFADVYYLADHPRPTKPPAVYGVDVISLATNEWAFVWHASQCQSEGAWEWPGPYIAGNSRSRRAMHYPDKVWQMLPALEKFFSKKDITLVAMRIKAMITRMKRTFWSMSNQSFKPVTKDLKSASTKTVSLRTAVKARFNKEMVDKDDPRVMGGRC